MKRPYCLVLAVLAASCFSARSAPAAGESRRFESGLTDTGTRFQALVGGVTADSSVRLIIPYGSFDERGRECGLSHVIEHAIGRLAYRRSASLSRFGFRLEGYTGPDRIVIGIDVGGGDEGVKAATALLLDAASPTADRQDDVRYEVPVVASEQMDSGARRADPASYFEEDAAQRLRGTCSKALGSDKIAASIAGILSAHPPSLLLLADHVPATWHSEAPATKEQGWSSARNAPPLRSIGVYARQTLSAGAHGLAVETLVPLPRRASGVAEADIIDAIADAATLRNILAGALPTWRPAEISFFGYSSSYLILRVQGPISGPVDEPMVTRLVQKWTEGMASDDEARNEGSRLICARQRVLASGPAAVVADQLALDGLSMMLASRPARLCGGNPASKGIIAPGREWTPSVLPTRTNVEVSSPTMTATAEPRPYLFRLCAPVAHGPEQKYLLGATAALAETSMAYDLRFSRGIAMQVAAGVAENGRRDQFCFRAALTHPFVAKAAALAAIKAWAASLSRSESADEGLAAQACFELRRRRLLSTAAEASCLPSLRLAKLSKVFASMSVGAEEQGGS